MRADQFPKTMQRGLLKGEWFPTLKAYNAAYAVAYATGMYKGRRVTTPSMARCSSCEEWKHPKDFHRSKSSNCGLQAYCKKCNKGLRTVAQAEALAEAQPTLPLALPVERLIPIHMKASDGTTIAVELPRELAVEVVARILQRTGAGK